MAPKEKSIELYNSFISILCKDCVSGLETYYKACLCAIEVVKNIKKEHDALKASNAMDSLTAEIFWDEVLIELELRQERMPRVNKCQYGNNTYKYGNNNK